MHPCPLTLVMWPWHWKKCSCIFSDCINASHLKMEIVTHFHIRLCNMASFSILGEMILTLENCEPILSFYILPIFWKFIITHYHIQLCNIVSLCILDLLSWRCDHDIETIVHINFSACVYDGLLKMDVVAQAT